jgi:threonine aldolase
MTTPMIDLRSDTVTKPSAAMRRAMADAEVGDDVLDGDPTTRKLEERTAQILGQESAIFFPSGSMANQAAIWALGERGTELYVHEDSHIVNLEMGGASALAGMQIRLIRGAPRVTRETLVSAMRSPGRDFPRATLLSVENTHNGSGGMVTPLPELSALFAVGRSMGCKILLDGARLWNACAATGTKPADFAATADATMVSFSKGLGAPVGAALAGSKAVIKAAGEARKRFGGGMRQSGIIAAGALYGLENNLSRLGEDHANAQKFAAIVSEAKNATVVKPESNIVMIDLPDGTDAMSFAKAAMERGVRVSVWTAARVRSVTHLDVSLEQVERAATVLRDLLN